MHRATGKNTRGDSRTSCSPSCDSAPREGLPLTPPERGGRSREAKRQVESHDPRVASGGPGTCLSQQQAHSFIEGDIDVRNVTEIDAHLAACPQCCSRVVEALRDRAWGGISSHSALPGCQSFTPDAWVADRYVIGPLLGCGGMGEVYEAYDVERQEMVALKTVRARVCDNPDLVQRLATEFALARRVHHENVCRVYALGEHRDWRSHGDEGIAFMTMELIEGESLDRRLQRTPLSLNEFRGVASGLLEGVAATHRAGILHRDIKSHNVMLRRDRGTSVAIIDFGLAVDADRQANAAAPGDVSKFSLEGSPAFMAPEQFRGTEAIPASDVFSSGVVFFHALTRSSPFRCLDRVRRLRCARRDPLEPPLRVRDRAPHAPEPLDAYVARCLDLDPQRRYPDAAAARRGLEEAFAQIQGR